MFYQRCMKGQILSENTFYNRALSIRDAIIAMVQVRTQILMHTEGETETERSRERGAGAWGGEPHTQTHLWKSRARGCIWSKNL